MTRQVFLLMVVAAVLWPHEAQAKRTPDPKVKPLVHEGVRFIAPNDNGRRGYIQAWNEETGKKVWEVMVFRNFIKPWLEECIQWVFIKELRIADGKLIVLAERGRVYAVDLKTRSARTHEAPPTTMARPPSGLDSAAPGK